MNVLENEPPSNKDLHNAVNAILKPFLSEVGVVQLIFEFSKWYIREDGQASLFGSKLDSEMKRAKFGDIIKVENGEKNVVLSSIRFESLVNMIGGVALNGGVGLHVSRFIRDPITFYKDSFVYEVILDVWAHQQILKKASSGRGVTTKNQFFVQFLNSRIYSPNFIIWIHFSNSMCMLNSRTPDSFLL
jgi:hypothetical protein